MSSSSLSACKPSRKLILDLRHIPELSQAVTTLKAKERAQKDWPATLAGEAAKSREVVFGKLQGLALQ